MATGSRLSPLLSRSGLAARLRGGEGEAGALRGGVRPTRVALVIAMLVAVALAHVHLRLQVIEGGYALSRESRLHRELEDQNQKLRLELATRRDPAVIERRARGELHMAPPDPAAIRTVRVAPERSSSPPRGGAPESAAAAAPQVSP